MTTKPEERTDIAPEVTQDESADDEKREARMQYLREYYGDVVTRIYDRIAREEREARNIRLRANEFRAQNRGGR